MPPVFVPSTCVDLHIYQHPDVWAAWRSATLSTLDLREELQLLSIHEHLQCSVHTCPGLAMAINSTSDLESHKKQYKMSSNFHFDYRLEC